MKNYLGSIKIPQRGFDNGVTQLCPQLEKEQYHLCHLHRLDKPAGMSCSQKFRQHSPAFKFKIALKTLQGKLIVDICRPYDVQPV